TQHGENVASLSRYTEVQAMTHNYIKKIVRRQSTITWRFNVIARNKKLLLSVGSSKDCRLRIVSTVSKKLQSQKRMSRPAFSQIDLDGVWLPLSVRAHHDKIQSEASDNSFSRETTANLCRLPRDQRSVGAVSRE